MNEHIQYPLIIPYPCSEDWDNMSITKQGRQCELCSKIVVDFTTMTNEEILMYINKSNEPICVRATKKQLLPNSTYKLSRKLKVFLYSLAITFLINIPNESHAQTNILTNEQSESGKIYGSITSSKGDTLEFAIITLFKDGILKYKTKSDINGHYHFNTIPYGNYTIRVNTLNYITQEIERVNVNSTKPIKLDFELDKRTNN